MLNCLPKLLMYQMSQCILLDHLDQYQTKFEISPIHQVLILTTTCPPQSVLLVSTFGQTPPKRLVYEIHQQQFLVLHDFVTAMQSSW